MTTAATGPSAFAYSHTVGFLAYRGRGFIHPVDLALGDGGAMYVLNRGGPETAGRLEHKRVCVCTVDEGYIGEWDAGGLDDGQFWWPSGIARSPRDGRLYIADEALQRVNIFAPDGAYIRHWGEAGDRPGQLNRPAAIAVAPDDTLLISDGLNHRIQRFTPDGELLHAWGGYGAAPGRFNTPGVCAAMATAMSLWPTGATTGCRRSPPGAALWGSGVRRATPKASSIAPPP